MTGEDDEHEDECDRQRYDLRSLEIPIEDHIEVAMIGRPAGREDREAV